MNAESETVPAVKDPEKAHPVASAWRPVLRTISAALSVGDLAGLRGVRAIAPISTEDATRILRNVAHYGETLVELPDDTWRTSVSQWLESHWEVIVDLWTSESGGSDLVMHVEVYESDDGFRFELHDVYVP